MSSHKSFFESPQAAAVYKHKLLSSYVPAWVGKVGSRSIGKRVVVYDAYSGPGRYEDENPGSPELLVDTAQAMANLRSVFSVFSEKDKGFCDRLRAMLVEKGIDSSTYEVRPGPVEDHVDAVLAGAGDLPLFVFLDPYGLTISFDRVVDVLKSRDKVGHYSTLLQPKTELLMNFSYEAVRRISGVVRSEKAYVSKRAQIESLDAALGGEWWQELARDEPEGWVNQVLVEYATRVAKAAGYGFTTAEVSDSLGAKPVYELVLFTRHPDGLWEMARSMSIARKEWRRSLVDAQGGAAQQMELPGMDSDDNEGAWVEAIAVNLEGILTQRPGFVIGRMLVDVFGSTLGLARETHVRQALKKIQARGLISDVPKGDLQKAYIARR